MLFFKTHIHTLLMIIALIIMQLNFQEVKNKDVISASNQIHSKLLTTVEIKNVRFSSDQFNQIENKRD